MERTKKPDFSKYTICSHWGYKNDEVTDKLLKIINLSNRLATGMNHALSFIQGVMSGEGLQDQIPEVIGGILSSRTLYRFIPEHKITGDYEDDIEKVDRGNREIFSAVMRYYTKWRVYHELWGNDAA